MNALAVVPISSLPALVERASRALAEAKSSAEILEARDLAGLTYDAAKRAGRFAKAKCAHDDLIAAAHRAQADALEIEAGAKRRLADEYDAAQERGEVATRQNNPGSQGHVSEQNMPPATVSDIGLTRLQVHEARQIRDAEEAQPGIVRRVLDERLDQGEEPTKASVKSAIAAALAPPERSAAVVSFNPREPFLPSFADAEEADEQRDTDYGDGPAIDLDTAEGRALAINGALQTIDFIAITGHEYWAVFCRDPAKTVYEGWVRNAHAKLSDLLKEIDNVQLQQRAKRGKAHR